MGFMDDVPDDPNKKPDNTYLCTITTSEAKVTKNGDKFGWNINLTITEGDYRNADIFDWHMICPVVGDEKQWKDASQRDLAAIKQRLLQFGVSHTKMSGFQSLEEMANFFPDLIGTENLAVKLRNNRIQEITLADPATVSGGTSSGLLGSI